MLRASSCLHADHSDASTRLRGSPPNLPQSDRHPQALEALRGEIYRIKVDASVCCATTLSLNTLWSLHRCIAFASIWLI
jgi:hypothetical protein